MKRDFWYFAMTAISVLIFKLKSQIFCYAEKIEKPLTPLKEYLNKIPINRNSMNLSLTCENEISKLIAQLPNKKSHGYDKINNCLQKSCVQ